MFKVIIVDDEYDIRQGLKNIINWEEQGFYIVGEAEDGIEALEVYEREQPSLIITDIKMPEIDGLNLTRKLKALNPDINILIISGYNDFTYAKEALKYGVNDYLLKPIDSQELCHVLSQIKERILENLIRQKSTQQKLAMLKDYFFVRLVKAEMIEEDIIDTANEYAIDLHSKDYCMLIIEIDNYGQSLIELSGKEIRLKKFAIRNIIEDILKETDSGYVFENEENRYNVLVIAKDGKLSKEFLLTLSTKIKDCLAVFAKESITIGIGVIVHQYAKIKFSYKTAEAAIGESLLSIKTKIFYYDAENHVNNQNIWNLKWDNTELFKAVRADNTKQIRAEIDLLFKEIHLVSKKIRKDIIKFAIYGLSQLMMEYKGDWRELFNDKFSHMEETLLHSNLAPMKELLVEICKEVSSYIKAKESNSIDSIIQEIVEYIHQHYWEEINLRKLSNLFYVNASYLGQLFKKETGEYFNDFINKIRIDNATKLLEANKLSIKDISEKIGYKYVDHFYRNFKAIIGVNPGDYRKGIQDAPQ
ncbi:response regulator transcription factor [Paenibacillus psychroresistens]|nr:response regulator transcription factor [Paenibacillus psychroresistens]